MNLKNFFLSACLTTALFYSQTTMHASCVITHIYLAERWLSIQKPNYSEEQKRNFIIGTLFPDMRYMAGIDRKLTHQNNVKFKNIVSAESAFIAGTLLHSFVDEQRMQFDLMRETRKYLVTKFGKHADLALKLLEDEILFDKIEPEIYIKNLSHILQEEICFGITRETVSICHALTTLCLSAPPSRLLKKFGVLPLSGGVDYLTAVADVIGNQLPTQTQNPIIQNYVAKFVTHFENLFNDFASTDNQEKSNNKKSLVSETTF